MDERIANGINKILDLPSDLLAEFFTKLNPLCVSKGDYFLAEGKLLVKK